LDEDQSFNDIDFHKLKILFYNVVGDDTVISNVKLEQILVDFYAFREYSIRPYSSVLKQLHILQLFAKVLFEHSPDTNSNLTIIYNILASFLLNTKMMLKTLNKKIYSNIKLRTKDLTEYYMIFFRTNEFNFQKDCLDVFFMTSLLDIDFIKYEDYQQIINSELTNIYFEYLKIKSNDPLRFESQLAVDIRAPIRSQLYEKALQRCKIKELIEINPNSKAILKSFYKFKDRILGNELQNFHINFNKSPSYYYNDKELVLTTDSNIMDKIREKTPLVFLVISALHIKANETIPEHHMVMKNLMYKTIYESLIIELIQYQSEDLCKVICTDLATNLTESLCTGYYINPITLERLRLYTTSFIAQLKRFISEVFSAND
jgi:hypothetical protein